MSIIKAILVTILYMILGELSGFWVYIPTALKIDSYLTYYILIQGIVQLILVLLILLIIRKDRLKNLIIQTRPKWYVIAIALAISNIFIQVPLNWIYNFLFNTSYSINYDLDGIKSLANINIVAVILILPLAEELLFRRYIQDDLQGKVNWLFAIILASFLFAFIHSPIAEIIMGQTNSSWHLTYITFFGGLFSGFLYYKSKSIGPSIIFHVVWNLAATIL